MLLSLCTYSVIIKMIDRNLSEVIDPSHYYYYLWDLVIINTIQNILSDKWKIFFWERTNERFWIFRLNINYVLKKEKKRKSYESYYVTVKVTFFFFLAKHRLLLKEQTKIQRQHPPTKHEHFWQTKSLDMDKPND